MTQSMEIFVMFIAAVPFVGFWLYELYYSKWFTEKNMVLREKYSLIWHAIKFWTIVITALGVFIIAGATSWFIHIPLIGASLWIVSGLFWNFTRKQGMLYPGDGKGGFLEKSLFWLSEKWKPNFKWTTVLAKLTALILSLLVSVVFS